MDSEADGMPERFKPAAPKAPRKPRPSEIAAKKAKAAKGKKKAKPAKKKVAKSKPKAKKPAKKTAKPKAKKVAARVLLRPERLELRLTKSEKAKLTAKAKAGRRTITSVVIELIERMR